MTSSGSPWADPATPTEPGPPYAGPPLTGAPAGPYAAGPYAAGPYAAGPYPPAPYAPYGAYGPPAYPQPQGVPPYAGAVQPPPHGYPAPWLPGPPPGARRPGQVIASAVLAFVQAALVGFASLYLWFAVSLIGFVAGQASGGPVPGTAQSLAAEGKVLVVLGLLSAVLLVGAGVVGLVRRVRAAWLLLVGAHAVQVLLAGYWGTRLYTVLGDVPGTLSEGAFATFALVFALAPLAGLGVILRGPGCAWFHSSPRS